MADNEHLHSATAKISNGGTTGASYTDYVDIRAISMPTFTRAKSKDTTLQSANRTHLYRFDTWTEPGDVQIELYFHQGQFITITNFLTATGTNTTNFWKITVPLLTAQSTPGNLVFQGGFTSIGFGQYSVDSDERIRMPCTISITGLPTWTSGS